MADAPLKIEVPPPTGSPSGTPSTWREQYPGEWFPSDIGPVVKHFNYDGVGRLYRVSSPVQAPDGWWFVQGDTGSSGVKSFTRSERFYYDGVRHIQEIVTDPVPLNNPNGEVPSIRDETIERAEGSEETGTGDAASDREAAIAHQHRRLTRRAESRAGIGNYGVSEVTARRSRPDRSRH